jgi:AcrR family transcriptional regulator
VPRKSASLRRQDLVEAGLRVIAREGIQGATVRAIVAEAGVPLATFHYVFSSRDEMIGQVYEFASVLPDDGGAAVPEGATLEGVILAALQQWFQQLVEHSEHELAVMEIMAYCARTPALSHLPAQVHERYLEVAVRAAERARERFGVTSDVPASEVAALALHVSDGITYGWLRTRDAEAAHRYMEAAVPLLHKALAGER